MLKMFFLKMEDPLKKKGIEEEREMAKKCLAQIPLDS